jgi:hypothetical protein
MIEILIAIVCLVFGLLAGVMIETSVVKDGLLKEGYILLQDYSKPSGKGRYTIIPFDRTKSAK